MNAGLFDMLHDSRHDDRLPVAQRVHVDLDRVREVSIEQERVLAEHRVDLAGLIVRVARLDVGRHQARQRAEKIVVERGRIVDDRHRPSAEHVRRAHYQREPEIGGDEARLLDRIGDAVLGLLQAELVEQTLEAVAILGQIDGIDRRPKDRRARLFDRVGKLQRRLAAELHDHPLQRPPLALLVENRQHVLGGQRLEIEPIRGVVVGRNRLGIAVDHDRLVARLAQSETGMAAAIVELDALPDPVRSAAQNDDLVALGGVRLAARRRPRTAPRRSNTCRRWARRTRPRRCQCA